MLGQRLNLRNYSTTRSGVLSLSHEVYNPSEVLRAPVVVMHGLFGSKQNWRSIAKQLSNKVNASIVAVDLRNHGDSPHSLHHDYYAMSNDVFHLCDTLGIEKFHCMGHSMGGKTAMHMALDQPSRIESLISVDMSPIVLNLTSIFSNYIVAMREIEAAKVKTQAQADSILAKTIPEVPIRQFILTNLKHNTEKGYLSFRINIDALENSLGGKSNVSGIAGFPLTDAGKTFDGPTLFVRGNKSGYVPDSSIPGIKRLFPQAEVVGLEAGHWVHSEKPTDFIKVVENFLKTK
ncbi:alpha/beta hydrolase fold protein [Obelidium mucronatum]|nr:alpha/beta hydrolase fold protein [Obelidium mucronatum]